MPKSKKTSVVSHEAFGISWSGVTPGSIADVRAAEAALAVRLPQELAELLTGTKNRGYTVKFTGEMRA